MKTSESVKHTTGNWVFVLTMFGDGSPCYAVKSDLNGYIVAHGMGQSDDEALANAQLIAIAVSKVNKGE